MGGHGRRSGLGAAVTLLAAVLALSWSPARGSTVIDWLMQQHGLDPQLLEAAPSARLLGFGNLSLAVADESNEVNMHDFGLNIAGVLEDGDGWVVESWLGNHLRSADETPGSVEDRFGNSGFQAIYRSANHNRALGAEVNWEYLETNSHPGDWARVRGPLISALINQRLGPVTAGFMLGRESENEDRQSTDFFSIRHQQSRMRGMLGVGVPLRGWEFGAQWQFLSGDVDGTSADPSRFHEDSFTWSRPEDRYTLAAIRPLGNGRLEGGVRAQFMDREGSEQVRVSWSGDSPENPSNTVYLTDAVTFSETESLVELTSLWRYHLDSNSMFGIQGTFRDWDHEVVEGINFKGSNEPGKWSQRTYELGVGYGRELIAGRLMATLEARGRISDWSITEELSKQEATGQTVAAGIGLEYFARSDVALRTGFSLGSNDDDADAPLTLQMRRSVSGGVSWLPRGGLVQAQAGVMYSRWVPKDEADSNVSSEDRTSYILSLRLLL